MMFTAELANAATELRRRALDRGVEAFERELHDVGIHLDQVEQLALLELVEQVESRASDQPLILTDSSDGDEPARHSAAA